MNEKDIIEQNLEIFRNQRDWDGGYHERMKVPITEVWLRGVLEQVFQAGVNAESERRDGECPDPEMDLTP